MSVTEIDIITFGIHDSHAFNHFAIIYNLFDVIRHTYPIYSPYISYLLTIHILFTRHTYPIYWRGIPTGIICRFINKIYFYVQNV
jgi:hypothetical protein